MAEVWVVLVACAGDEGADEKIRAKNPGLDAVVLREEEGCVWSIVLESQLLPWLALLACSVKPGKTSGLLPPLFFSHAARVAGSTGQASGGVSVSFDMLYTVCRVSMFDGVDDKITISRPLYFKLVPSKDGWSRLAGLDDLLPDPEIDSLILQTTKRTSSPEILFPFAQSPSEYIIMADVKIYQASTTAPVNIAVVKYILPLLDPTKVQGQS